MIEDEIRTLPEWSSGASRMVFRGYLCGRNGKEGETVRDEELLQNLFQEIRETTQEEEVEDELEDEIHLPVEEEVEDELEDEIDLPAEEVQDDEKESSSSYPHTPLENKRAKRKVTFSQGRRPASRCGPLRRVGGKQFSFFCRGDVDLGTIIGKGGKFAKMAKRHHGVRMVAVNDGSGEVCLTGPKRYVEKVYKEILFRVDRDFNLDELTQVSKGLFQVGAEDFVMLVDKEFRDILCGPQDITLKRLFRELNVAIYIPDKYDERDYITISGPLQNALRAEKRIRELIDEVEDFPRDQYIQLMSLDCYGFHLPIPSRGFLLARRGHMVEEVKYLYDVQVILPKSHEKREIGYLCGELDQVVKAFKHVQVALEKVRVTEEEVTMEGLHRVAAGKYHFDVDPQHKGLLVGPGGENLKRLENQYNVSIIIHKKTDGFVTLHGQPEDVKDACEDINKTMKPKFQRGYGRTEERERKVFPEKEIFRGLTKVGDRIYRTVLNREERAMVIGRGGENIRRLMTEHQIHFQGPKMDDDSNHCTIRGCEEDAIAFYNDVLDIIRNKGHRNRQGQQEGIKDASPRNYGKTEERERKYFPEEEIFDGLTKIGDRLYKIVLNRDERAMVIGRGGENIKQLIADHKVRFQGPKMNEDSNDCTIRGEADDVINFYNDVIELIKNKGKMNARRFDGKGQDECGRRQAGATLGDFLLY
ncbi:uncharacterized protein [Palaemon carinicauda]|uniref:uncharacterized protein n=1 Tax=Palaemon carinicauda TaxID=392227 RepID=UPI0035B67F77